jgi:hypothetical protein
MGDVLISSRHGYDAGHILRVHRLVYKVINSLDVGHLAAPAPVVG